MSSIKYKIWMLLPLMAMISCESILDKFPEDKITPETFFTTENELELYSNNFYVACISGTGVFKDYGDVIIQPILEATISDQRAFLLGMFSEEELDAAVNELRLNAVSRGTNYPKLRD